MSEFQGMLHDFDATTRAMVAVNHARQQFSAEAEEWHQQVEALKEANSGNLAIRYALMEALRQYDPKNPLLHDQDLIERMTAAAYRAVTLTDSNYDAARVVGLSFEIPGRSQPGNVGDYMKRNFGRTVDDQGANRGARVNAAERIAYQQVLLKEIQRLDPENPVVQAFVEGNILPLLIKEMASLDVLHPVLNPEEVRKKNASEIFAAGRAAFLAAERANEGGGSKPTSGVAAAQKAGEDWLKSHPMP